MGMAITDTLITESGARVVMIDRACQLIGRWTTAYPFVRLPAIGLLRRQLQRALGNNTIDLVGWNQGPNELAPVGEYAPTSMLYCSGNCSHRAGWLLPDERKYLGMAVSDTGRHREYVVTVNRLASSFYLRVNRTVDAAGAVLGCTGVFA